VPLTHPSLEKSIMLNCFLSEVKRTSGSPSKVSLSCGEVRKQKTFLLGVGIHYMGLSSEVCQALGNERGCMLRSEISL
jgi:hypothetical protein